MSMNWDESLPDVSCWRPMQNNNTLKSGLEITCQLAQHRIHEQSQRPKSASISSTTIRALALRT